MEPVILGMEPYVLPPRWFVYARIPPAPNYNPVFRVVKRPRDAGWARRFQHAPAEASGVRWALVATYEHDPAEWRAREDVQRYYRRMGYS